MAGESNPRRTEEERQGVQAAANAPAANEPTAASPPKRWSRRRKIVVFIAGLLLVYLMAAYLVMPALWKHYVHRHPSLEDIPAITHTGAGIPGDPINVALIGTKEQ